MKKDVMTATIPDRLESKYKDASPVETVHRIRNILTGLGLSTVEHWINSLEGVCSLRVEIAGTRLGTNGKGASREFALASAYAELMERLQNHVLYLECDLSPEVLNYGGFYFSPDEKYMSAGELLEAGGQLVDKMVPEVPPPAAAALSPLLHKKAREWFGLDLPDSPGYDRLEFARRWTVCNQEGVPCDFVARPFYSLRNDSLCYVPMQMGFIPYGSNGMCAGNTPEEALVQGFSEIFERYANREIMLKKITPPTVPEAYLEKYPRLHSLLKYIETEGKLQVLVKDCSLGRGLPVLGLAVIDREKQSYIVQLGAHPVFAIALERCITELLQGRRLHDTLKSFMTTFVFADRRLNHPGNMDSILKIGVGSYPAEFFSGRCSYEFTEFKDMSAAGNRQMLRHCAGLLLEQGCDVLIRDVSHLGFPSYFIIVPGVSEIFEYDETALGVMDLLKHSRLILRNPGRATGEELRKVVSYLLLRLGRRLETDNLGQVLGLPLKSSFPWLKKPILYFVAAALYKMNKPKEALGMMNQLLAAMENRVSAPGKFMAFYKCVRDYLQGLAGGLDPAGVEELLEVFYPREILDRVLGLWGSPEHVFDDFGALSCWNCRECAFNSHCSQEFTAALNKKLKDREKERPINQMDLRELFINLPGGWPVSAKPAPVV